MELNKDYNMVMRGHYGFPCGCIKCRHDRKVDNNRKVDKIAWTVLITCLLLILICARGCNTVAMANENNHITVMIRPNCFPIIGHTCSELADAIYKAENSKKYPYGIKTKYKHTSPKMACINTINHSLRDWLATDRRKRFLAYLQERYCPTGQPLCENWQTNVSYWLAKGDK